MLEILIGKFLCVRQWAFINGSCSDDSTSVWQQLIHSHSLYCTMVPWGLLSLLVVSLPYVNGLHQWLLIRWFHSCSTSRPLFTWDGMCQFGCDEDPGEIRYFILLISPPRLRLEFCNSDSYILQHRSTFILGLGYDHCLVADPQCISSGYTCHDSFFHGSTMYFLWPWSRQLHLTWICSVCFGSYTYLLFAHLRIFWYRIGHGYLSSSFASFSQ